MQNKGYLYIGAALVGVGLLFLLGQVTGLGVCAFFWPLLFIGVGVIMLLRPRMARQGTNVRVMLLGDVRRHGDWAVGDEEIWLLIGDVTLDMTHATIPEGETCIRAIGFVGTVRLFVPEDTAVALSSTAFITDARFLGQKRDSILAPYYEETEGYAEAARKVRLETFYFVGTQKIARE